MPSSPPPSGERTPRPVSRTGPALESQTTALIVARTALDKQAERVVVLDVRSLSTVTDFFIVCTADSSRHLAALKEHIEDALVQHGAAVWHTEGTTAFAPKRPGAEDDATAFGQAAPQWVLMDCGDVVVHLLDQQGRAFYRLEELWADAPRLPLETILPRTP